MDGNQPVKPVQQRVPEKTGTQPEEEKRFTQSELNEILQRRLAREKRKRGALKLYVSYLEKLVHELAENGGKTDE